MPKNLFERRHYNAIAKLLHARYLLEPHGQGRVAIEHAITDFVRLFEDDNPRFSAGRFLVAAGSVGGPAENPRRRGGWPIGSVSSGTLRTEDLLEAFTDELQATYERTGEKVPPADKKLIKEARAILNRMDDDEFANEEDADAAEYLVNEELVDALESLAPSYIYFGGHEGDPADIGWWVSIESLEEDARSGEVLKVDAGDELPKGYTGLVMDVSDHGNVTLYHAVKGERKAELWGIV